MSVITKQLRGWVAVLLAIQVALPLSGSAQTTVQESGGTPAAEGQVAPLRKALEPWALPTITIAEPQNGAIVTREDQAVVITFRDSRDELDLSSLRVWVNGADHTKSFRTAQSGAVWQPTGRSGVGGGIGDLERQQEKESAEGTAVSRIMRAGQNTIVASIKNKSGMLATTSSSFIFDPSLLLTNYPTPRSPLERGFLQPPSLLPAEQTLRQQPPEAAVSRDLVQFGYETFKALLPSLAPAANMPVDPEYKLGPGDNLILYVWNLPGTALLDSASLTIDRTGSAFIPRVGAVALQGITVTQAQEVIRVRIARNYSGFEVRLTLGELRGVSVYVVGEVARPGTYTISPFSTVLDALFVAGGPTKMGTLRSIRVSRSGGAIREIDLYDFLLRGERPPGPNLQSGDTVFVTSIGPVAAVTGQVKRPGIYELRPGTTVGALIAMAGGPLPGAQLDRAQVERTQGARGKILLDLPIAPSRGRDGNEILQDGDLVTLLPGQDHLRNVVSLEGFVQSPGRYEWKPGLRLSEILTPDRLMPEAYQEQVEVVRVRPDFSREVISVNLRTLWGAGAKPDSGQDLELQPQDRISVRSEVVGPMMVNLSGEVRRPGKYAVNRGERLSSVIDRAGGFLPSAFLRGAVFTRESLRRQEKQQMERFVEAQTQSMLAEGVALTTGGIVLGRMETGAGVPAVTAQRRELLQALQRVVVLGRMTIHLDVTERLKGTVDDVELEDGDTLTIPQQPKSVTVFGAVRNPTAVLYKQGENAEYYINRVGGAMREADVSQMYILKSDGSAVASFVKMRQVEPGDAIIVPISTDAKIPPFVMVKEIIATIGQLALPLGVIYGIFKD